MNVSIEFGTQRNSDGLATMKLVGEGFQTVEVDLPFKTLHRSLGTPSKVALDLLTVAGACYVIDKTVRRDQTSDRWTRELTVSFPVSDPERWTKVASDLDAALTFLSGDVWKSSFRDCEHKIFVTPKKRSRSITVDPSEPKSLEAVALFSGGLDSLIGAIDFLAQNPTRNLMLVGHYDSSGPKSQQRALHSGLKAAYSGRTKLIQVRVAKRPKKNAEPSLRARSIIFLALGAYAASKIGGDTPLLAPENGLIALNLPLTPSRVGSCSTRTMHPFYLELFRNVIRGIGLDNPVLNPLELKTKAECVSQCANAQLLAQLAPLTVSCSHGSRRQEWKRRSMSNCGYCVPCLFRRTSLHAAMIDVGLQYGFDVCAGELDVDSDLTSGDDLRALTSCLRQFVSESDIRRAITSVAKVNPVDAYVAMVDRGLNQIRGWIRDKGSPSLRQAAGI